MNDCNLALNRGRPTTARDDSAFRYNSRRKFQDERFANALANCNGSLKYQSINSRIMRDNIYLKELAMRIRAIRNEQKITLRELGALCNLQHDAISRIENGQKDSHILTLKNIANKLDVDIRELV